MAIQLSAEEQTFGRALWAECDVPPRGYLGADQIKTLFTRSQLPARMLSTVWTSTTKSRPDVAGTVMEPAGFALALRMIAVAQSPVHRTKQYSKAAIMAVIDDLPLPKFAPATGGAPATTAPAPAAVATDAVPTAAASVPAPAGAAPPTAAAVATTTDWSMNENQYKQYAAFFTKADTDHDGYASMAESLVFFKQSKLEKSILAAIWKLSDADADKRLSTEEFVVAMHLIMKARGGAVLPAALPPHLAPPAIRERFAPKPAASGGDDVFGMLDQMSSPAAGGKPKAVVSMDMNLLGDILGGSNAVPPTPTAGGAVSASPLQRVGSLDILSAKSEEPAPAAAAAKSSTPAVAEAAAAPVQPRVKSAIEVRIDSTNESIASVNRKREDCQIELETAQELIHVETKKLDEADTRLRDAQTEAEVARTGMQQSGQLSAAVLAERAVIDLQIRKVKEQQTATEAQLTEMDSKISLLHSQTKELETAKANSNAEIERKKSEQKALSELMNNVSSTDASNRTGRNELKTQTQQLKALIDNDLKVKLEVADLLAQTLEMIRAERLAVNELKRQRDDAVAVVTEIKQKTAAVRASMPVSAVVVPDVKSRVESKGEPTPVRAGAGRSAGAPAAVAEADPFGDDANTTAGPGAGEANTTADPFGSDDPFGAGGSEGKEPAAVPVPISAAALAVPISAAPASDGFDFGDSELAFPTPAPLPASPKPQAPAQAAAPAKQAEAAAKPAPSDDPFADKKDVAVPAAAAVPASPAASPFDFDPFDAAPDAAAPAAVAAAPAVGVADADPFAANGPASAAPAAAGGAPSDGFDADFDNAFASPQPPSSPATAKVLAAAAAAASPARGEGAAVGGGGSTPAFDAFGEGDEGGAPGAAAKPAAGASQHKEGGGFGTMKRPAPLVPGEQKEGHSAGAPALSPTSQALAIISLANRPSLPTVLAPGAVKPPPPASPPPPSKSTKPKPAAQPDYEPGWVCPACTLVNRFTVTKCDICSTLQPKTPTIAPVSGPTPNASAEGRNTTAGPGAGGDVKANPMAASTPKPAVSTPAAAAASGPTKRYIQLKIECTHLPKASMFRVRDGLVALFVTDRVKKTLVCIDQTEIIVNEKYPKFQKLLKVAFNEYTDLSFCVYDMYGAKAMSNQNLLGYVNMNVSKLLAAKDSRLEQPIIDHTTKKQLKLKSTMLVTAKIVELPVGGSAAAANTAAAATPNAGAASGGGAAKPPPPSSPPPPSKKPHGGLVSAAAPATAAAGVGKAWSLLQTGMVFNLYTLDMRTQRAVKTPIFLFWRTPAALPLNGTNLGALYWCTPASAAAHNNLPTPDPRNSLPVLSVTEYRVGRKTPILNIAAADEARCFALVAGDVAFNLEAEADTKRTAWLEALGALMARKFA